MKKQFLFLISSFILLAGCNKSEPKRIAGQPYIEIEGTEENGIRRKYNEQGIIESEIPYKDSKPHGIQKTYYKTGKLFRETPLVMGRIEGVIKEYYPSGNLYREMPNIDGKAEGIIKKYYEDGKLMAESPYSKGKLLPGLKEYDKNGNPVEHPKLVFKPINKLAVDGSFIIEISLSDNTIKSTFSQIFIYENREASNSLPVQNGKAIFKTFIPKGNTLKKTLIFQAEYTTIRNNVCLIRDTFNCNVSN